MAALAPGRGAVPVHNSRRRIAAGGSWIVLAQDLQLERLARRIGPQHEAERPAADLAVLDVLASGLAGVDQGDEAGAATGTVDRPLVVVH